MCVKERPPLMAKRGFGRSYAQIPIHIPHRGNWVWPVLDRYKSALLPDVGTAMGHASVGMARTHGGQDSGSTHVEIPTYPPLSPISSWVR